MASWLPLRFGVERPPGQPVAWQALFGGATSFLLSETGPDNSRSTSDTLALMHGIATDCSEGAGSGAVDNAARRILASLPFHPSPNQLLGAVFGYVKRTVRFTRDESLLSSLFGEAGDDSDLLITPARLLTMPDPQGDCDCMSMLVAALLLRLGVPCAYVTIKADPERPEAWSHVYATACLAEGDVAMDASHGEYAGWEYPGVVERRVWLRMEPEVWRSALCM